MNADQVRATYRRGAQHAVQIRRYDNNPGPNFIDYPTTAKLVGVAAEQQLRWLLTEGVAQYAMRAIVLVDDLVAAGMALPITSDDKMVWNGREWAIEVPDGATRYVDGTLIAYQLMIRG